MAESQTVIRIDTELLREFKAECLRRNIAPTTLYTKWVKQQLHEWLKRKDGE